MSKNDLVLLADIFKPKGHLYIVRGVPGSGKSTYAKELLTWYDRVVHIEADMFFSRTGQYLFDREKLHSAHNWCLNTAQILLNQNMKVVVSNTFTTYSELKDYIKYATINGHGVTLITMDKEYGSIHDVPEETMQKMRDRFETHNSIRNKILNKSEDNLKETK